MIYTRKQPLTCNYDGERSGEWSSATAILADVIQTKVIDDQQSFCVRYAFGTDVLVATKTTWMIG